MIFDHLTFPKVTSLTPDWQFYLYPVLLITPFKVIYATWPCSKYQPQHPKAHPWVKTLAEWNSRCICFISFICENIHKVKYINLANWLCNWSIMKYDLLIPPQGPRRRGGPRERGDCIKDRTDERTDGRTDERADRWTEAITISPFI